MADPDAKPDPGSQSAPPQRSGAGSDLGEPARPGQVGSAPPPTGGGSAADPAAPPQDPVDPAVVDRQVDEVKRRALLRLHLAKTRASQAKQSTPISSDQTVTKQYQAQQVNTLPVAGAQLQYPPVPSMAMHAYPHQPPAPMPMSSMVGAWPARAELSPRRQEAAAAFRKRHAPTPVQPWNSGLRQAPGGTPGGFFPPPPTVTPPQMLPGTLRASPSRTGAIHAPSALTPSRWQPSAPPFSPAANAIAAVRANGVPPATSMVGNMSPAARHVGSHQFPQQYQQQPAPPPNGWAPPGFPVAHPPASISPQRRHNPGNPWPPGSFQQPGHMVPQGGAVRTVADGHSVRWKRVAERSTDGEMVESVRWVREEIPEGSPQRMLMH